MIIREVKKKMLITDQVMLRIIKIRVKVNKVEFISVREGLLIQTPPDKRWT